MRTRRAILPACALAAATAGCSGQTAATLHVTGPAVVRPVAAGAPAPLYLSIDNPTSTADTLLSVSSSTGGPTVINNSLSDSASDASQLPVPAHSTVALSPFESDILLVSPGPLTLGSSVAVTLVFAHAGAITVHAPVESVSQVAATATPP